MIISCNSSAMEFLRSTIGTTTFDPFMDNPAMTNVPRYVFTEAVLEASTATSEWASWLERSAHPTPEDARRYFSQFFGATSETEDDMAQLVLGGNNMGGGVPLEVLRKMARLSKVA